MNQNPNVAMALSTVNFIRALSMRQDAAEERDRTVPGRRHINSGKTAVVELEKINANGDIHDILTFEQAAINFDLDRRVNSTGMKASLEAAAHDLKITLDLVAFVQQPNEYLLIDRGHTRDRNRIGDLPRDEARQFFKSHFARLLNQDKTGLDDAEKQMLDIRRANISRAEKLYAAMQRQALGLPEQSVKKGRGRA